MKQLANILLADDNMSGLVELLVIVVLVIIGAIVSAVQKARKEKESQETSERWRREREQKEREERQAQGVQEAPPLLGRMEQQARQNLGLSSAPPSSPVPVSPVRDDGEAALKQKRDRLLKLRREAKLARKADVASRHLKEDVSSRHLREGIVSKGVARPATAAAAPAEVQPTAVEIDLSDLSEAQRAIVHLEILSPPKALKHGAEMWDA